MTTIYQDRLQAIISHIEKHPKQWRQETWHCHTKHCIGGFAQVALLKHEGIKEYKLGEYGVILPDGSKRLAVSDMAIWLGFKVPESLSSKNKDKKLEYLSDPRRTLEEIKAFCKTWEVPS